MLMTIISPEIQESYTIPHIKRKEQAGEMAHWVRALSHKHEGLRGPEVRSLIPT